ncbi:antibiotic biosynthesis monooxygenase family protein [Aureibacillus halotolerans]|uniref:Heme-degrading monooxygenase HmoA n=1 Tax=Aureibacillus halotolerans TaxID=1508390 RepID=A0A4R6U682_9BACI|nr:hypothetical protein [Aureibacillus halotolerans]TDQ42008.1 hypothetical protein EV213_10236 [Aureibacillus halotolerans]
MLTISKGTYGFLKKWQEHHEVDHSELYLSGSSAVLIVEGSSPVDSLSQASKYEVLASGGTLHGEFAVMRYLPISEDAQPIFEQRHKNLGQKTGNGLLGIRLLKPKSGDMYCVVSIWDKETSYQYNSVPLVDESLMAKGPGGLFEAPFTKTYHLPKE